MRIKKLKVWKGFMFWEFRDDAGKLKGWYGYNIKKAVRPFAEELINSLKHNN